MKKLIVVSVLFSFPVFACQTKVDPSKVMLFIDTNNSELEIDTAKKAACARGEVLKIVPKNYLEYGQYTKKINEVTKKFEAAKCSEPLSAACKTLVQDWEKAYKDMSNFRAKQKPTSEHVKEALEEVKASKGKLQHLSISGHDGGGHFSGNKGSFGRVELTQLMSSYTDINDVKSLLLLGCYTGTQNEVMAWKAIFPKTRLIGGYDGSAPLADRPQGHQYITDILLKEKQMIKQSDEKKLQSYVNANLKGLGNLNAAMYVQCSDGTSEQSYYYASKKNRNFEKLQVDECMLKIGELSEVANTFARYESGELEVPADTTNGALRQLYNKARTYEHCADVTGVFLNVNGIFNMLFYEGVKKNFAHFYKDDLKEVEKYLNFDPEEMEKNFNENLKPTLDMIAKYEEEIKRMDDPQKYLADSEKEVTDLKAKFETLLNAKGYEDVKSLFNSDGAMSYTSQNFSQEQLKKISELSGVAFELQNKKFEFDQAKISISQSKTRKTQAVQSMKKMMEGQKIAFRDLKTEIADSKNKIWSPTEENLKKYSRKDLMKNIHQINKVMASGGLKGEQMSALSWLAQTTSGHLQMHRNPFEWHEYTGTPKKPDFSFHLKDALSNQSVFGMGGMYGGYGSGGSLSGGTYVGGSSSGSFGY